MLWGTFDRPETDAVHVAPCNQEGRALHVLSMFCSCRPRIERPFVWSDKVLIVHRQES